MNLHQHKILILDFGSQYTQLIARRIREIGVYCELWPWDSHPGAILDFMPNGIILSGGPESVAVQQAPEIPACLLQLNVPILGICYGMQALAQQLGGIVSASATREFGYAKVTCAEDSLLLADIEDEINAAGQGLLDVWMSHGDKVTQVPQGFKAIASSESCALAAIEDSDKKWFGVQFHPEVTHTRQGMRILERFVCSICACPKNWKTAHIVEETVTEIKAKVGDEHVLLGLSGGVDSSVAAALLHRALGEKLTCVFVDNGLLRLGEAQQVMQIFQQHLGVKVIHVDAVQQFLSALSGICDPEEKRKTIGRVFVEVFQAHAQQQPEVKWLAQGTIYPDIIESAGKNNDNAHVIKSHHNVGGLPETLNLKLLEPLQELFKDEVRKVGLELGLPYQVLYRHPFPGPGLGVRVLGEIKREYCDILRAADAIFIEELHEAELYDKVSQAFAVFLPVRSVGVMGDGRRYDWVIALRAVETLDFMTAHWAHLPYDFLGKVSHRIVNEVHGVSRVVYDISGKPPATIEWE